jgi:hypothetical protein
MSLTTPAVKSLISLLTEPLIKGNSAVLTTEFTAANNTSEPEPDNTKYTKFAWVDGHTWT